MKLALPTLLLLSLAWTAQAGVFITGRPATALHLVMSVAADAGQPGFKKGQGFGPGTPRKSGQDAEWAAIEQPGAELQLTCSRPLPLEKGQDPECHLLINGEKQPELMNGELVNGVYDGLATVPGALEDAAALRGYVTVKFSRLTCQTWLVAKVGENKYSCEVEPISAENP
jgi:hypothetical protein